MDWLLLGISMYVICSSSMYVIDLQADGDLVNLFYVFMPLRVAGLPDTVI